MRIALCGVKNSGKDYVADKLTKTLGCDTIKLSFSDSLKQICRNLFPFMEPDYPSKAKETPLNIEYDGVKIIHSPRQIWNSVGMLRMIDPHIFIRQVKEMIEYNQNSNIIVKDMRTFDEYSFLKNLDFKFIYIERDVNIKYDEYDMMVSTTLRNICNFVYENKDGDINYQRLLNFLQFQQKDKK